MKTENKLAELIATPHVSTLTPSHIKDLQINWQAAQIKETSKGKPKSVVCGIPGPVFWQSYRKHAQTRAVCKALGITTRRLAKNEWEAVAWINRHTRGLFELATGFTIPDAPETSENPF